jgi:subtilisin family serine protease/subtilisin-like proprotein convertase family protein
MKNRVGMGLRKVSQSDCSAATLPEVATGSGRNQWALALALLSMTGVLTARPASADYFYSGGQKIELKPSTSWVAVQVEPNTSGTLVRGVQNEASLDTQREAIRISRNNVLLLPTDGTAAQQQQLRSRLNRSPVVQRTLRVYGTKGSPLLDAGEFVVRFRSGASLQQAQDLAAKYGATVVRPLGAFAPGGYVVRVNASTSTSTAAIAAKIYENEAVQYSHPDFWVKPQTRATVNDPLYPQQWHLHNTSGPTGSLLTANVRIEDAWDVTKGSPDITIAVLDDGFDLQHEDFGPTADGTKIVFPRDFADEDFDPSPADDNNHGTAVAGVATATGDNGIGVTGAAPRCKLLPVRIGFMPMASYAAAFEWARANGADVINNSWGFDGIPAIPDVLRNSIDFAVQRGRDGKGCVILFAAGNSGRAYGGESSDDDPLAAYDKVISVGSSNSSDLYSTYSEPGLTLDVVAPSNDDRFGSLGITTTDRTGDVGYNTLPNQTGNNNNYTDTFGGTSSACPLVAGVVGLLLSSEPSLNYQEVRQRLIESADKIDANNQTPGIAYDENGHSPTYGYGRVNAGAVLSGKPIAVTLVTPADNTKITGNYPLRATTDNNLAVSSMEFQRSAIVKSFSRPNVNLAIPDFDTTGITDTFTITDDYAAQETEIQVMAQINHPFVRDLEVNLITPDGKRHPLYEHDGGLERSLSLSRSIPSEVRPITGTYTIEVVDDAQQDVGTLVSWGVTIGTKFTRIAEVTGRSGAYWVATWPIANTPSGNYTVRALAHTRRTVGQSEFSDSNTNINVVGVAAETYSISGRIVNSENKPVANVVVSRSDKSVRTNANGEYTLTDVPLGTHIVSPALTGAIFSPTSREVRVGTTENPNASGINFTLVSRDSQAPQVTVTNPVDKAVYRSLAQATGTASDLGGSVSAVSGFLFRNGTGGGFYAGKNAVGEPVWETAYNADRHEMAAKGTTNWSIVLPELPEGRYGLRATVRDRANNIRRSAVISFSIDRTNPTVSITTPVNKAAHRMGEAITATGKASDVNGISRVTTLLAFQAANSTRVLYYAGTEAGRQRWDASYTVARNELLAQGTTSWKSVLPALQSGVYSLRATAYDRAGNSTRSIITVFSAKSTATTKAAAVGVSSDFSNATVDTSQSTLTLSFSSSLQAKADAANFSVSVDGNAVEVESLSIVGNRVVLRLPQSTLQRGNRIEVLWSGLTSSSGLALANGNAVVAVP